MAMQSNANTHSVFRADIVFVTEMKTGFILKRYGGGGVKGKGVHFHPDLLIFLSVPS